MKIELTDDVRVKLDRMVGAASRPTQLPTAADIPAINDGSWDPQLPEARVGDYWLQMQHGDNGWRYLSASTKSPQPTLEAIVADLEDVLLYLGVSGSATRPDGFITCTWIWHPHNTVLA